METFVFLVAGAACLVGALGVVLARHPVHSALSLVGTLFGVAVLFVAQNANFLAAVQVIVYAGAIVVLFLFVIMLLGVDQSENLSIEPIVGQRAAAVVVGVAVFALPVLALASAGWEATGQVANLGPLSGDGYGVELLGEVIFTRYLLAFEVTSVLLVIAVVGAVMLARKNRKADELEIEGLGSVGPDGPRRSTNAPRSSDSTDDEADAGGGDQTADTADEEATT
ncbi:MAG: NADH-quinone oxidoreductase subunit J [Acidimicrobiales bacterium]|nr:NADH-quinone oxidoreductase subunit J [Acidimicrobiales bacterium]